MGFSALDRSSHFARAVVSAKTLRSGNERRVASTRLTVGKRTVKLAQHDKHAAEVFLSSRKPRTGQL
jgi:hypothetical protein